MKPIMQEWVDKAEEDWNVAGLAVALRHPGGSADKEEAHEAIKLCRAVRAAARLSLGLPV